MQVVSVETLNNILCFVRGLSLGGAFRTSARRTDQTRSVTLTSLTLFLLTFDNVLLKWHV